jgi:hypothetical protein
MIMPQTLIQQFEEKTLPLEKWTHEAHLTVGLWHLCHYPLWEAHCLMRAKIIAYNQAVGTPNTAQRGYHETLTVFWLKMINLFLEKADKNMPFEELVEALLKSEYASRNLHLNYYAPETIFSVRARATYISL